MDRPLSADQFQPHIGKDFKVKDGRHALTLRSVDLRRLEAWETALFERNPFTLIFSGPPRDVLPAGMYTLEVANGPSFELHVIPILTPVATRQDYQSIFN
jgi:Domain of unknown function (DUF6916)